MLSKVSPKIIRRGGFERPKTKKTSSNKGNFDNIKHNGEKVPILYGVDSQRSRRIQNTEGPQDRHQN